MRNPFKRNTDLNQPKKKPLRQRLPLTVLFTKSAAQGVAPVTITLGGVGAVSLLVGGPIIGGVMMAIPLSVAGLFGYLINEVRKQESNKQSNYFEKVNWKEKRTGQVLRAIKRDRSLAHIFQKCIDSYIEEKKRPSKRRRKKVQAMIDEFQALGTEITVLNHEETGRKFKFFVPETWQQDIPQR